MIKEKINKTIEIAKPQYLREIEGNGYSRNQLIVKKEMIKDLVEEPLVPACEELYDKNIQTLESSANITDLIHRKHVGIVIEYDSLSQENKDVAFKYFGGFVLSEDDIRVVSIKIPVETNSQIKEIIDKSLLEVAKFKKQPLSWSKTFTFKEVVKIITLSEEISGYSPEDFTDYFYYDKESEIFYLSQEHYNKINEFNNE